MFVWNEHKGILIFRLSLDVSLFVSASFLSVFFLGLLYAFFFPCLGSSVELRSFYFATLALYSVLVVSLSAVVAALRGGHNPFRHRGA